MSLITQSFKQACPHCQGDGVDVAFELRSVLTGGFWQMRSFPVVADCPHCNGTGIVEVDMLVKPEWVFPEIGLNEFTL